MSAVQAGVMRGGVYMSGDTSGEVESVEGCCRQREKQLSSPRWFQLVSMRTLQKKKGAESMKIKVGRFSWPD